MRIVFTNGCFDLIHPGHIRLLRYAKSLGDRLVVAIDDDARVISMKGHGRPIQNLADRLEILAAIRYVDEVHSFADADNLRDLVKEISPQIMIVGSDWQGKEIVGQEHAGEVRFFDRIERYSTTDMIESIQDV